MQAKYLSRSVYHMVHFDNLESIFQRRALLSKEKVIQEGIAYHSIAYDNVQSLRDRVFVWDTVTARFRPLHSYVPFYIATRTPMLYVQLKQGLQDRIVILEVPLSIVLENGTIFTNGNASNQQLSKYSSEVVNIMPATIEKGVCRRRYRPSGPHGKNPSCSDFYDNQVFLKELDWDVIEGRDFSDVEKVRAKHAEVLVPDLFPLGKISDIAVNNQGMIKEVNKLIYRCNLTERIPSPMLNANLFFKDG